MKNSKGSSKQFSQYLNSEYHDSVLEPLDPEASGINKLIEHNCFKETVEEEIDEEEHNNAEFKKKYQKSTTDNKGPKRLSKDKIECPLTREYLKQVTLLLGSDAKNCYTGLFEFRYLTEEEPYLPYKQIYQRLDTVPMLFLSISRSDKSNREIEAVYLWQINREAPYVLPQKSENYTPTDITEIKEGIRLHTFPSMLLLAKIVPEDGERILGANLVGESKLIVRSVKEDSAEVTMRLYSVTRLFHTMRINPYKQHIIGNDNYSFLIRINFKPSEKSLELITNLWKRSTLEEMDPTSIPRDQSVPNTSTPDTQLSSFIKFVYSDTLLLNQTLTLPNNKDVDIKNFFSTIPCSTNEWMLFVNNMNSTLLLWNEEALQLIKLSEAIHSIQELNGSYHILDQSGQFHQLALDEKEKWTMSIIDYKISFAMTSSFEFQVIELSNQTESQMMKHIVYFHQSKFYAISLEEKTPTVKVLLDIQNKIEEGKNISWKIYSIEPVESESPNTVVIAFFLEGYVYFHDIETERSNSVRVLLQDEDISNNWQMTASSNGTLYLHDLQFKNILVSIPHGVDPDDLFTKDFSRDIDYIFLPKANAETKEDCSIKFVGDRDFIMLIPREDEPFYEDVINKMYPLQESVPIITTEKPKEITKEKEPVEIEISEEDKEAGLIKKIQEIKRQITYSKDKEHVLEESQNAMVALRENISESKQKIWKYDKEIKEWNRKNKNKRYWYYKEQEPKEVKSVSKESLALFAEMKLEKKKIKKQNEKEKDQNKKERRSLFE